jgi:hypothetical protein
MLLRAEITKRKCIVDKVSEVRQWIEHVSKKREELGGHAICPYAFSASVKVVETALSEVTLIEGATEDIIIFIVGDNVTLASMLNKVAELNMKHQEHVFLDDHVDEPTHIMGIQSNFGKYNMIMCQRNDKLLEAREKLHKTDYYTYWHQEMYQRIINGKFPNRQEQKIRRIWNDTHNSAIE